MKKHIPYLVFLLFILGCAYPPNDPDYLSEQEKIVSMALDDTILLSGIAGAFYIEYERWPYSSIELESFIKSKSESKKFDKELVKQCLDFIHLNEGLTFDIDSSDKLTASYRFMSKVDVTILLTMEKADLDAEYDYILKVSSETYQVDGQIEEIKISKASDRLNSEYDDFIFQLVIGIIQGLIQGNNTPNPYHN